MERIQYSCEFGFVSKVVKCTDTVLSIDVIVIFNEPKSVEVVSKSPANNDRRALPFAKAIRHLNNCFLASDWSKTKTIVLK